MKKKTPSKIVLSKETIRQLENPNDLREAAGGYISYMQSASGCQVCRSC